MAALTFPSPTQLKNISGPTDGSDAATKTYVDSQLSDQAVNAAGSNTEVQFNNANSFGASSNFTFNSATSILTVTGNIVSSNANLGNTVSSNYFIGSGNNLSNIQGANVSGQVANALLSGTVYTNAQPNITSVGTLSSLSVTGDISGTNLTLSGNLLVGGTLTTVNSTTTRIVDPIVEQGGGANAAALSSNDGKDRGQLLHYYTTQAVDAFMGWDNSNAEFAFGSNVTVASDVVTFNNFGNIRAGHFIGNGSQLTGMPTLSSDVDEFTGDGANVAFTLSVTPASKNFTFAVVQGIMQPKSSYSVSGAILTFSSPPPLDALVEVTTMKLA